MSMQFFTPSPNMFVGPAVDAYITVRSVGGSGVSTASWKNVKIQYRDATWLDVLTPLGEIQTYKLDHVVRVFVTPTEKSGHKVFESVDYSKYNWPCEKKEEQNE